MTSKEADKAFNDLMDDYMETQKNRPVETTVAGLTARIAMITATAFSMTMIQTRLLIQLLERQEKA